MEEIIFAFPNPMRWSEQSYSNQSPDLLSQGMTLRDYFAARAMAEVPLKISQRFVSDSDYDDWAKNCYRRADALIKNR